MAVTALTIIAAGSSLIMAARFLRVALKSRGRHARWQYKPRAKRQDLSMDEQGGLYKILGHIAGLHGQKMANAFQARVMAGEDRISIEEHRLYKRSGVWWYYD